MAQSAKGWLTELTNLYTPTSTQFDAARRHRGAIESRLDAYIGLREMFEIGSLRQGTGVWQYSDADFLASLKGIRPGSIWTMLDKVKETLQERFVATEIVIRRPAVVCRFSDGCVEVVPGYPDDSGYFIADPSTDGWIKTYPKDHNAYVNQINNNFGGAVKGLARQAKIWKYLRNVPISSCYLEMRAAKHMEGENSYSALWDLYLSFKKMHDAGLAAMNDPTGLGSRFGACSSESSRQDAMSKLGMAVSRALKAKNYDESGDSVNAIEQLKLLFNR